MPDWKSIYSYYLKTAGELYYQQRLEELERLFDVMEGIIHDDTALEDLKKFRKQLDTDTQWQIQQIHDRAEKETHPLKKAKILEDEMMVYDWRLREWLFFHQQLAKKYGLLKD